jgi:putative membrane protein
MKHFFILALKGMGMGAANVIPGVSGGTVALITGIFEELINSIKSLDLVAIKLLLKFDLKGFSKHINLPFLIAVFFGIGVSIISFAWLLGYLFENYPIYIWSFFFGLILASVIFVGKTISKWDWSVILVFIIGTAIAFTISFMKPASENTAIWYLVICGIVAASSMILPGLSGSFILLLLGNYQLIMITAVKDLNIMILAPVVVGAAIGLLGFSHFLSWIFEKYKNQTIAVLSGFIFGSLTILWPWKEEITKTFGSGEYVKEKVIGYNWLLPDINLSLFIAISIMIAGFIIIWVMEKYAGTKEKH